MRPSDVTTIQLILNAVTVEFTYGIIINKVPKKTVAALKQPENFRLVLAGLNSSTRPTQHYYIIEKDNDLEDADNGKLIMTDEVKQFIFGLPATTIEEINVNKIQVDNFDIVRSEFAEKLEELKRENEQLKKDNNWRNNALTFAGGLAAALLGGGSLPILLSAIKTLS